MTNVKLCDSQMTLLSKTDLGYVIDFYRRTYGQNNNNDMVGDVEKEIIQCITLNAITTVASLRIQLTIQSPNIHLA